MFRASKLSVLFFVVCSAVVGEKSSAVLTIDGIPDSNYQHLSDQYSGQTFALFEGGYFDGSGVRLNQWYGLTAAHCVENHSGVMGSNFSIVQGANFNSPDVTRNVSAVTVYPGYNPFLDNNNRYTPDFALIKFADPLAGQDVSVGSAPYGSIVTTVGYGATGTYNNQTLAVDGNIRAFNAPAEKVDSAYYDSSVYDYFSFVDSANYIAYLNGKAEGGDSGGPGFNAAGQLVTITDAASNGVTFSGYTLSTRLDPYSDWINTNSAIPEPTSLAWLLAATVGGMLRRRRDAAGAA